MTMLLDQAIARLRELPEAEQNEAAEALDEFIREAEAGRSGLYRLSDAERAAVRESREQARRGEFATDEEMEALFARPGR
jgi:predicted transcriptional regulator